MTTRARRPVLPSLPALLAALCLALFPVVAAQPGAHRAQGGHFLHGFGHDRLRPPPSPGTHAGHHHDHSRAHHAPGTPAGDGDDGGDGSGRLCPVTALGYAAAAAAASAPPALPLPAVAVRLVPAFVPRARAVRGRRLRRPANPRAPPSSPLSPEIPSRNSFP